MTTMRKTASITLGVAAVVGFGYFCHEQVKFNRDADAAIVTIKASTSANRLSISNLMAFERKYDSGFNSLLAEAKAATNPNERLGYDRRLVAFMARNDAERDRLFDEADRTGDLNTVLDLDKALSKKWKRTDRILNVVLGAGLASILVWPFKKMFPD